MGIYKIELKKERKDGTTHFIYPAGYDSYIFDPFLYQNEGKDVEYCLAKADDSKVKTSDKIVKLTKTQAKKLVDNYVDSDKDISLIKEKFKNLDEQKNKRKTNLKKVVDEA